MAGGDIEYRNIGLRKWEVKLTVYRYCDNSAAGICSSSNCSQTMTVAPSLSISQGGLNPNGCTANPASVSFTLQLQTVIDVEMDNIERCGPQSKNGCTNLGQVSPGVYRPSVEKYIFIGVLDMSSPAFNAGNTCPYWDLGWTYCCRNSTVNVQGQPSFFIQSTLNIAEGQLNSSPAFKREGIFVFCAGQEYVYNMAASDPDGDSLTYQIRKSLEAVNTPVHYNTPFSEIWPFPLISTSPPHNNYPGQPFVVLDSITGDLSMNASNMTTGPIGGQICLQVMQWRYKEFPAGSGIRVPYVVGVSMRDQQIYSVPCVSSSSGKMNNPPKFATQPALPGGAPKMNWDVCAGQQLCFTITAKDADFSPNDSIPRIDSTFLSWDNALVRPGKISFGPDYDTTNANLRPREDRWKFCWQTELSDTSTLPYYFTVKGMDNFCPTPAKAIRSFSIKVGKQLKADITKQNLGCGRWEVKLRKTDITQLFSSAVLEVANQPNDKLFAGGSKMITSSNLNPSGTGNTPRAVITDSLRFAQSGKYYLRYTVMSTQTPCVLVSYDSIEVPFFNPVTVSLADTFKCKTGAINLSALANGGTGPLQYRWFKNASVTPVHTSFTSNQYIVADSISAQYSIQVNDSNNCTARDTMQLIVKRISNNIILVNTDSQCLGSNHFSFSHSAVPLFTNYTRTWLSEQTTSNDPIWNKTYSVAGTKQIALAISEPGGCSDTAFKNIEVWPMPVVHGVLDVNDSVQCLNGNNFLLTYHSANNPYHYRNEWIYDSVSSSNTGLLGIVYPTAGNKRVKLILSTINGCKDTIIRDLLVKSSPAQPVIQGQQTGVVVNDEYDYSVVAQAGNSYKWSVVNGDFVSADTTPTVRVKWTAVGQGILSVQQDLDGCKAEDSIMVAVGSTGLNELDHVRSFRMIPNPSNGRFMIQLESEITQQVQVKITNTFGGEVLTRAQHLEKGMNEIRIHTDVATGVYLLSISNGSSETVRKIVISK